MVAIKKGKRENYWYYHVDAWATISTVQKYYGSLKNFQNTRHIPNAYKFTTEAISRFSIEAHKSAYSTKNSNDVSQLFTTKAVRSVHNKKSGFWDSLAFLPVCLISMPNAFGLERMKKVICPFLFAKAGNFDYIGPVLDTKYCSTEGMQEDEFSDLVEWHSTETLIKKKWDFKEEVLGYCENDAQILRLSCLQFRANIEEITGLLSTFRSRHCSRIRQPCLPSVVYV